MTVWSIVLRVYLLAGLTAHKATWELLKRRNEWPEAAKGFLPNLVLRIVKGAKIALTLGLIIQLFLPEILPITGTPLRPRIAGIVLFTFGLLIAVLARVELGKNWSDIELGEVRPDHRLINRGVYRYVRHPIYAGDLTMLLGFQLALNSWLILAIVVIAIPTVYGALREEKMLAKSVADYEAYCAQTKRFIPFVI